MKHPDETYYDILNIPHDASPQDISSSYRKLAKVLHPDVCESSDAEELFKVVNEAYQILRDPKKRAEYDSTISLTQTSRYKGYYQGSQRYRHPRTWYYSNQHHSSGRRQYQADEGKTEPHRKGIPRFVQVLLFYLSLFMAIVIIVELFLLPWIDGANATDARGAFLEGNKWVGEEEYQKAIESYQNAVTRLPSFSEAWRAKGLAEVKKADILSNLGKPDAERYYRDAIRSFSQVTGDITDDITLRKGLAKAFFETGEGKKALNVLTALPVTQKSDPEISALIQKINSRMSTMGGTGRKPA